MEIKDHLETDENHNKRNGNTQKTIITKNGSIVIDVPRDRNSTFEPVIIPKRQRKFDNFDQKVISLYAKGMTISDIKAQLQEFYHGAEVSKSLIIQITNDIIEEVKMWQIKHLEKIYPIVYFDYIVVKVKQDKRIINKAVYLVLGININGLKDILGMWISGERMKEPNFGACPKFCVSIIHSEFYSEEVEQKIIKKQKPLI